MLNRRGGTERVGEQAERTALFDVCAGLASTELQVVLDVVKMGPVNGVLARALAKAMGVVMLVHALVSTATPVMHMTHRPRGGAYKAKKS